VSDGNGVSLGDGAGDGVEDVVSSAKACTVAGPATIDAVTHSVRANEAAARSRLLPRR
jgi:hypothetical protein